MISRFATLIIACAMVCPEAIAQTSRPDSATKTQSNEADLDAKGLLAGPEVKSSAEDQKQIRFDGSKVGRGGRGRATVSRKRWFALLKSLELNQDQNDEIRPILQSLQKANRKHTAKHGKRFKQLQKQAQQARSKNRKVPREVRQEITKLNAKGPRIVTYQKRIWEILTTSQQEKMRKSLALIRNRIIVVEKDSRITDKQPANDKAMKETEKDNNKDDMDEQSKRRLDFLKSQQALSRSKVKPGR
ncbi:MAG: hypothetical protein IH984_13430 [Planctomycetes bacterium]|nr:hypothetical protein [Planctomycetota bacterium]